MLELEAGAIVWAIKYLRSYPDQVPFIAYSNEKAL